jgi:hypothetical protein
MTAEEIEKEVLALKDQLSFWRGAFIAGGAILLGWMSIQSFVQIPQKLETLWEAKAGKHIDENIRKVNSAADDFENHLISWLEGQIVKLEVAPTANFQSENRYVGFIAKGDIRPNSQDAIVVVGRGGPNEDLKIKIQKQ